jgi:predicted ArsR family transcriptional regulator
MKTSVQILTDLRTGQSTIEPLAQRLRQPPSVIHAFLEELETDGLVESSPVGNPDIGRKLTVWRITEAGHLVIA